jgi:hypothetical protein
MYPPFAAAFHANHAIHFLSASIAPISLFIERSRIEVSLDLRPNAVSQTNHSCWTHRRTISFLRISLQYSNQRSGPLELDFTGEGGEEVDREEGQRERPATKKRALHAFLLCRVTACGWHTCSCFSCALLCGTRCRRWERR